MVCFTLSLEMPFTIYLADFMKKNVISEGRLMHVGSNTLSGSIFPSVDSSLGFD